MKASYYLEIISLRVMLVPLGNCGNLHPLLLSIEQLVYLTLYTVTLLALYLLHLLLATTIS